MNMFFLKAVVVSTVAFSIDDHMMCIHFSFLCTSVVVADELPGLARLRECCLGPPVHPPRDSNRTSPEYTVLGLLNVDPEQLGFEPNVTWARPPHPICALALTLSVKLVS